jgi:phosphoglycerate dehydrogenase-like enzyme
MLRVAVINDYMRVVQTIADWSILKGIATVDFFHDHLRDEAAVAARLASYDVIVSERDRTPFTRTLFERLPNLKLLVTTGAVNWMIDFDAAKERNVLVCYTGGAPGAAPELTWGLLLALARRIAWDHAHMRAGGWQTGTGVALPGKMLGLIGLGNIGQTLVRYAKAFDMKTQAWSKNLTAEAATAAGSTRVELDELLRTSDFVVVCVVLSDRTRGLLGARELGLMKPEAYLINTSRGPIVQEAALLDALRNKRIAGAALDVYDIEPLPVDHPLRMLENVVLTPHTGYITDAQYKVFYGHAVEDIVAYAKGQPARVMTGPYMLPKR